MTSGLMARLFVVPAIIVSVLLAVAVVVVLFGSTSVTQQRTIGELLDVLEKGGGEREYSLILLPGERDYWQAAQELSRRLMRRDQALSPEEIEPTAARILAILDKTPASTGGPDTAMRPRHFLMMALGRLGDSSAAPALLALLGAEDGQTRLTAVRSLAEMHESRAAREAVSEVLPLLDDPDGGVRLVSCAAIAALAEPGDPQVIRALSDKLSADREMQWNAAMALARLGSDRGKLVLENMLQRGFWEKIELEYEEGGTLVRRRFSDVEVSNRMVAAIEAASLLRDSGLDALIAGLREDSSHLVRGAALSLDRRSGASDGRSRRALGHPSDVAWVWMRGDADWGTVAPAAA